MMNLSDSVKNVLKTKKQSLLKSLVKEDFKIILKELVPKKSSIKNFSFKDSFHHARSSVLSSITLIKVIPRRLNEGLKIFTSEFVAELEKLPDQKQKTVFCMKVLAGLSKLTISFAYDMGLGEAKLLSIGKTKNVVSNVILSKVLFRSMQAFILRFIAEIEKDVTDPEELQNLQSFKDAVTDDSGNAIDKFFDGVTDQDDKAFSLVENLKIYLQTGEA